MGGMEFKIAVIRKQQLKNEIKEAKLSKLKKGMPPKPRVLPALDKLVTAETILLTEQQTVEPTAVCRKVESPLPIPIINAFEVQCLEEPKREPSMKDIANPFLKEDLTGTPVK